MKLASWNVNSIRVRLPQLLDWLAAHEPDVVCLQETKVVDADFPAAELANAGYRSVFAGQKTYNGVAILSREEPSDIIVGLSTDDAGAAKRLIAAEVSGVTIVDVYVPNGSSIGSEKYEYKMDWLERLEHDLRERFDLSRPVAVCGDFNIAPDDRDVYDPEGLRGHIMFGQEERNALQRLLGLGLTDTLRLHTEEGGHYSWWDYRRGAFRRNMGWRIDLILASAPLAAACLGASIDPGPRRLERPSDHTPVLAELDV